MKKLFFVIFNAIFAVAFIGITESQAANDNAVIICGETPSGESKGPKSWEDPEHPGRQENNEFWNDTYLMWELAYGKGEFPDNKAGASIDHVHVLYGEGSDYETGSPRYQASWNDLISITDYSAYYQDVANIFNWLANGHGTLPPMTTDDMLFCWTFGHGDSATVLYRYHSYLCLMGDDEIRDDDFANKVDQISCWRRVFWMEQCFTGGFINDLKSSKTVVTTACREKERAQPADDNSRNGSPLPENELYGGDLQCHGEFDFHIMNAARGKAIFGTSYYNPPEVDANLDEHIGISMKEAWIYVRDHESLIQTPEHSDIGTMANSTFLIFDRLASPDAPTNLRYKFLANGQIAVTLSWDANTEPDLSGYNVYRNGIKIATTRTNTYTDYDIRPGRRYHYKVTAFAFYGKESGYSNTVTVEVPDGFFAIGKSVPSPYLVQRDGYIEFEPTPDKSVDYDRDSLVYIFSNLDPQNQYKIGLVYYEPENAKSKRIQTLKGNGVQLHDPMSLPNAPTLVEQWLPRTLYSDGKVIISLHRIAGDNAIVSEIFFWKYKEKHSGGTQTAGESATALLNAFYISPNPSTSFKIRYMVPKNAQVTLSIYDMSGRIVNTLVNGNLGVGYHSVDWDAEGLASGIYFAKLKVTLAELTESCPQDAVHGQALPLQSVTDSGMESYTDTKKLILLR